MAIGKTTDQRKGIVEVPYRGRLGNRLSQYCVGRILAEELGYRLEAEGIPGFPNSGPVNTDRPPPGPEILQRKLIGHRLPIAEILREGRDQRLLIAGHFHRYEIFRPYKERVRNDWLAADRPLSPSRSDLLTIHVRAGDIWQAVQGMPHPEYQALPFSFYEDIVRSMPWGGVRVVTEDAADPMVQKLASTFGATVHSGELLDDFNLLRGSANLVLSVSSFAWWAAFLSAAQTVYYPVAGLFDPARARRRPFLWQQDLWVGDEPRYRAIRPTALFEEWTGSEEQRQQLLDCAVPPMWDPPSMTTDPHRTATGSTGEAERSQLAFVEGFRKPGEGNAQGTHHAAYLVCQALAQVGPYSSLHVYRDSERRSGVGDLTLPRTPPCRVFEKVMLSMTAERYEAIYVANGEQIPHAPHLLRPQHDWAPVVCSIGTAHANLQWSNLLLALASGAIRSTDGFIFKSRAAQTLFRHVWRDWSDRLGLEPGFSEQTVVIPNGVDVEANRRSDNLRQEMRQRLRLADDDIVFLSFSRLSPGTKGDLQALVVRWKEVIERLPSAVLILSGTAVDGPFVADLRQLIRAAGVGNRVSVIDNPTEVAPNPRGRLMSAADAFVHLSTGIEETSSLVVHEAMAHGLPVIAAAWAGMPEIVSPGINGFLVPTVAAPVAPHIGSTLFGQADRTHVLFASKVVACDWTAFVQAAAALGDAERRRSLGAASRRQAESNDLGSIARRYVRFFGETSRAAQRAWSGPRVFHPLVQLDDVVRCQASGQLQSSTRIRLGDPGRLALVSSGLHPEARGRLERLLARLGQASELTVGDLAAATAGPELSSVSADGRWLLASSGRFLVRLLNFGVIEPVRVDDARGRQS